MVLTAQEEADLDALWSDSYLGRLGLMPRHGVVNRRTLDAGSCGRKSSCASGGRALCFLSTAATHDRRMGTCSIREEATHPRRPPAPILRRGSRHLATIPWGSCWRLSGRVGMNSSRLSSR